MQNSFYEYTSFNEKIWKRNCDRFFFLFSLGVIYSIVYISLKDFQVSLPKLLLMMFFQWYPVLGMIVIIEGLIGMLVKIALNPGSFLLDPIGILKTFFKGSYLSFKNFWSEFKTPNSIVKIPVITSPYIIYGDNLNNSVCVTMTSTLLRDNFLKAPEHFK